MYLVTVFFLKIDRQSISSFGVHFGHVFVAHFSPLVSRSSGTARLSACSTSAALSLPATEATFLNSSR